MPEWAPWEFCVRMREGYDKRMLQSRFTELISWRLRGIVTYISETVVTPYICVVNSHHPVHTHRCHGEAWCYCCIGIGNQAWGESMTQTKWLTQRVTRLSFPASTFLTEGRHNEMMQHFFKSVFTSQFLLWHPAMVTVVTAVITASWGCMEVL